MTKSRELSLPVRGAWIEIVSEILMPSPALSLPVRGAWIEIECAPEWDAFVEVAPRTGSVD